MFLQLLPSKLTNKVQKKFILKLIKHQVRYAMQDSRFLGMPASEIAFTAAYNATMMTLGKASLAAYQKLQQSMNVNLLPLKLESTLMFQAQNSGILADFIHLIPSQRAPRRKSSTKSSEQNHLSPRCVTMSR